MRKVFTGGVGEVKRSGVRYSVFLVGYSLFQKRHPTGEPAGCTLIYEEIKNSFTSC